MHTTVLYGCIESSFQLALKARVDSLVEIHRIRQKETEKRSKITWAWAWASGAGVGESQKRREYELIVQSKQLLFFIFAI